MCSTCNKFTKHSYQETAISSWGFSVKAHLWVLVKHRKLWKKCIFKIYFWHSVPCQVLLFDECKTFQGKSYFSILSCATFWLQWFYLINKLEPHLSSGRDDHKMFSGHVNECSNSIRQNKNNNLPDWSSHTIWVDPLLHKTIEQNM